VRPPSPSPTVGNRDGSTPVTRAPAVGCCPWEGLMEPGFIPSTGGVRLAR
jgi:hypothetical protein